MKAKQKVALTDVKPGQVYLFICENPEHNSELELVTVTEKRVYWYVGFSYRSGGGKNIMKMAGCTRQQFERSIINGGYKLKA